uniref:Uncharacterized protein n=1 Tax=Steinernema glaseri TaxID=37863 RepID=A0A1I7Z7F3_9BILA
MDLFHGFFSAFSFLFRADQRRHLLDMIDRTEENFSEREARLASARDVDLVNVVFPALAFLLRQDQRLDQIDLLDEPLESRGQSEIRGFDTNLNHLFIDHNNNVVVFQLNNNLII